MASTVPSTSLPRVASTIVNVLSAIVRRLMRAAG